MNPYEAPTPPTIPALDRRDFLRLTSVASGGLILGSFLKTTGDVQAAEIAKTAPAGDFTPNAFIRLGLDGSITLIAPRPDSGQGVKTSLPMLLAEDLEAPWQSVTVQMADLNAIYGSQSAGGSTSMYIGRRNTEGGGRQQSFSNTSFRAVVGVRSKKGNAMVGAAVAGRPHQSLTP